MTTLTHHPGSYSAPHVLPCNCPSNPAQPLVEADGAVEARSQGEEGKGQSAFLAAAFSHMYGAPASSVLRWVLETPKSAL